MNCNLIRSTKCTNYSKVNFNLGISRSVSTRLESYLKSLHCNTTESLYWVFFSLGIVLTPYCLVRYILMHYTVLHRLRILSTLAFTLTFATERRLFAHRLYQKRISTEFRRLYYGISCHSTQFFISPTRLPIPP